jgi:ABC-type multidrug transport system fused ATPase/permease subunit
MTAIRKLLRFLRPHWYWATLAPVTMLLEVAMDLMQPRMIQRIVDDGIVQGDLSVVINDGEIVEQGTHTQLLESEGFYHDLYVAQFKGHPHLVPELAGD